MVTAHGKRGGGIGLVLSGGGAKGAFQAGVWRAMCELGLAERVEAVSGTSVGALNGAAFAALRDPLAVCRIWLEHVGEMASANFRALSPLSLCEGVRNMLDGKPFPFSGLLDRSALERLVRTILPGAWPEEAPSVHATALECRAGTWGELDPAAYHLRRFRIDRERNPETRLKQLLASAAIPWGFDPVEIGGKRYVDGGWDAQGGDNVPVAPISEHHGNIRTVVVVRCNGAETEPEPLRFAGPSGVRVVEVRPRTTLPGIFGDFPDLLPVGPIARQLKVWSGTFAFNREYAEQYIRRGYAEGMAALRPFRPKVELEW